jgi:hypothetical protein
MSASTSSASAPDSTPAKQQQQQQLEIIESTPPPAKKSFGFLTPQVASYFVGEHPVLRPGDSQANSLQREDVPEQLHER